MAFKDLKHLFESDEMKAKAAEGFAERQKKREEEFERQAKILEPSDKWYERSYNI